MAVLSRRLAIRFDADGLAADARSIAPQAWEPHFNAATYRGEWSGVALRSSGGTLSLYPDPHGRGFADTELMERSPHVRRALSALRCAVTSVRFLRLGAGAEIFEHRDYGLSPDGGEARLHVCVQTNDGVVFVLGGEHIVMRAGECWFLNVAAPHRAANAGASPRIHLVIDCIVNAWLESVLAASERDG